MTCRWLAVISSKLTETVVISFYQAQKIRVSLLLVLFFSRSRFPRALLCWGVHSADKYLFHADNLSFRERLFWFKVSIGKPGGSYFLYILLNEIRTMFSLLAWWSSRVLPAGLFTDHAHYVINQTSTVLRRKKIMAVEDGIVSPYYILVIYVAFQT